jgi:hypothetical protein
MQYAIVEGQKREASPGLLGTCPLCGAVMTPKCGKFRVAHWAHPPGIVDHRWEPETEWHRNWKGCFPFECQEIVHQASSGEKHIADVKTTHGRVIEFQNSAISDEERRSREEFYRPMCWVVNGQRLKWDRRHFFEAVHGGKVLTAKPLTLVVPVDKCLLLRKWADSRVRVFFDFGDTEEPGDVFRFGAPVLWAAEPGSPKGMAVLRPVRRSAFLEAMINGGPLKGIDFSKVFERVRRAALPPPPSRSRASKPARRKYRRFTPRTQRTWSRSGTSTHRSWRKRSFRKP